MEPRNPNLADLLSLQKKREALLTKNFNSLNFAEKLEYEKAYLFDYLYINLQHYFYTLDKDFRSNYLNVLNMITNAQDDGTIQGALALYAAQLSQWKSSWVEGAVEKKLKKISSEIVNELQDMVHNFSFYACEGIVIHPSAYNNNKEPQKKYFTSGLPDDVLKKLMNLSPPIEVYIMYVSGSGLNSKGHALLYIKDIGFLHVDELFDKPKFMTVEGFNDYMRINGKTILGSHRAEVVNTKDFILYLEKVCRNKWAWDGIAENCLSFTHESFKAGGIDINKFPEFNTLLFKLPTDHLRKTRLADKVHAHRVTPDIKFSEALLSIQYMEQIPIINYAAIDVIKFLTYMKDNMVAILKAQAKLIDAEDRQAGNRNSKSSIDRAGNRIQKKVDEVIKLMTDEKMYGSIFKPFTKSPLFNQITESIMPELLGAIKATKEEKIFSDNLYTKFRASEIPEIKIKIIQEDESKSKNKPSQ